MGPTALLPLWRKSCYGFLSPLKIHCPRPGLNPQTLGAVASTLPLDHREQYINMVQIYQQVQTDNDNAHQSYLAYFETPGPKHAPPSCQTHWIFQFAFLLSNCEAWLWHKLINMQINFWDHITLCQSTAVVASERDWNKSFRCCSFGNGDNLKPQFSHTGWEIHDILPSLVICFHITDSNWSWNFFTL
jgi:hypothetical protein